MAKEQVTRRREILAALPGLEVRAQLYGATGAALDARRRCLQALVADLVRTGAVRLVLERVETQERADRQSIRIALAGSEAGLTYLHQPAHEEPLLWAADVVAWAYGAGDDWRRRVDGLVDKVVLVS